MKGRGAGSQFSKYLRFCSSFIFIPSTWMAGTQSPSSANSSWMFLEGVVPLELFHSHEMDSK